jgi:hypothetical protein
MLINVVECTYPLLGSLEISFMGMEGDSFPLSTAYSPFFISFTPYSARKPPLKHLKHFAIKD